MAALKDRERSIIERNENGYYRCKNKHQKLYRQLSIAYAPYITKEMLSMLNHNFDTQKNEALNNSVAAYAPKSKTYSMTSSLECRVGLAAGVQIK